MKVIQVTCPNCHQPVINKFVDRVFWCDKCNTMHTRNGGTKVLDIEIGNYNPSIPGQVTYMPFWRVWANFAIHQSNSSGGTFHKLGKFLRGDSNQGSLFIFVPAMELNIGTFKNMAINMTLEAPRYATRMDFANLPRSPVKMTKEESFQAADFVFVTMEADKPGILQQLDYTLDVQDARLVYLPFIVGQDGIMHPAW
ncbi:MAG: hypothetical protein A4E32_01455 [Methanomassiliicoccales archaeon PtaU1.Bin124]|nr:MAG: hypothetical protein A4E32_01455 [Methanomassiliicoccales archaeon PtaU1.Bin124]